MINRDEQIEEMARNSAQYSTADVIMGAKWADANPRPIDWEEIWKQYNDECGYDSGYLYKNTLREIIEKQFKGT
jgi:hypothetical protein